MLSKKKSSQISVRNLIKARVGDAVEVCMDEANFLRYAFLSYFLPILMMIIACLMAEKMLASDSEGLIIFCGLAGLLSGLWLAKKLLNPQATDVFIRSKTFVIKPAESNKE